MSKAKSRLEKLERARRLARGQIRGIVVVEDNDALTAAGLYRVAVDRLPVGEAWAAGEAGHGNEHHGWRLVRRDALETWAARMGYALIIAYEYEHPHPRRD